ncbi:RagB/SusD family nutrient uptake outer membrane protein [Wenyingzhuangia sp. IMCC45533]
MKKRYNIIVKSCIILSSCFVTISCTDDFLDQSNPNRPEVRFEDLDDTDQGLNALYNNLYNQNILSISFEALTTDLAAPTRSRIPGGEPELELVRLNNLELNNSLLQINGKWAALYRGIFLANQVIFGLEQIESSIASQEARNEWTIQMAQARLFRGMYHFYAHSTFNEGKVVIRDRYIPSAIEAPSKLSSSEEVIEFYLDDLNYALTNLPNVQDFEPEDKGRVTKGVAAMLLANHYLYQEEYDLAIPIYEKLTQTSDFGDYTLAEPEIMFTTAGEFNSESILEVNYTVDVNFEQSEFDDTSLHNSLAFESSLVRARAEYLPASWLIQLYQDEESANQIDDGFGGLRDRTVSKRASAMIALVKDEEPTVYYGEPSVNVGYGSLLRQRTINDGQLPVAYLAMFKKYTNHDIRISEQDITDMRNRKSGKNVTILRLAEAYINLAECYIERDRLDEALEQMNVVRRRWDVAELTSGSFSPFNKENVRQHLRHVEKPLELSVEGHATRTIDLRRWGAQDRYNDVSQQSFSLQNHGTLLLDRPVVNPNSIVIKGDSGASAHRQFVEAAQNYGSYGGYLPLPSVEILNNENPLNL